MAISPIHKKKQIVIAIPDKLDLMLKAKSIGWTGCIPDPIDSPFGDSCVCSAIDYLWDKIYGG